jgi:chemotaxis protein CheD
MPEAGTIVRIAEFKAARSPEILSALGLGSCVAILLWDPDTRIGGLAHVMLPSSLAFPPPYVAGKFPDTAIPALLDVLTALGAGTAHLRAKLIGGSNMFNNSGPNNQLPLGLRNVMAARNALNAARIPVMGEEVGGIKGRTVHFQTEDGRAMIRKVFQPDTWI